MSLGEELQIPEYSSWQRHTVNTCLPPPGKLSGDAERSFELPGKPEDTSGDTLGQIRAWIVYEGLAFCHAQTLQQDRSSEFSFAAFLAS